jgi:cell division protein FtsI (penicillin-binding protein 3)
MATHDLDPLHTQDRPDEAFEMSWRRGFRRRLLIIGVAFVLWTAGIQARLVFLQVVAHPDYLEQANEQQMRVFEPAAKRGDLLDRNGEVLAYSVDADTIAVNPRVVRDPKKTVAALCGVFRDCSDQERASLVQTMTNRKLAFAYIRRGVAPGIGPRVAALKLPGVEVRIESKRYYPNREMGAHLIGFVGRDNNGLGGIEQAYDSVVRGKKGRVLMLTDAKHASVESRVELEATAGATLELTIDQYLQHIAERELRAGVEKHNATAGTLVALDPSTGEILALANYPTFNPNTPGAVDADLRRNRAVQEVYEPGSTFKMVTAAAAIEEGLLTADELVDTAPGYVTIPGRDPIRDEHYYGPQMTFHDVIVKSSNVGAIRAGWQIGAERLNRYVRRFGFGEIHAPDFRGVSGGKVWRPEDLNQMSLASVSMGYQVSVTPMQMAAATAAIANGGTLFEPHLVRAIIRDGVREEIAPKALRRAIAPATAATLTTMMEDVVVRGTAKAAAIPGYQVAGKTGTAQKIVNRAYSSSNHYGSFTGFVPSRRPALAVLVVIDDPKTGGFFGGVVAAPIFQKFSEAAMRHLGITPTINPTTPILMQSDAMLPARYSGRLPEIQSGVMQANGTVLMPDVTGLGARDATRVLVQMGLTVRMSGNGVVLAQTPVAGEEVTTGVISRLELGRARPVPLAGGRQ